MKSFRLIGDLGSIRVKAHSSLAAGAMWKSEKDYYAIGELETIEDLKDGTITKAKKPRQARAQRDKVLAPNLRPHFAFDLRSEAAPASASVFGFEQRLRHG